MQMTDARYEVERNKLIPLAVREASEGERDTTTYEARQRWNLLYHEAMNRLWSAREAEMRAQEEERRRLLEYGPGLVRAAYDLLADVMLAHPGDFGPGGPGFTCPKMRALHDAAWLAREGP